jgi:hypothetical protein
MGQGTSSDVEETEETEKTEKAEDMIKIKVIYYAFADKNDKDEKPFQFETELSRDQWVKQFKDNNEYLTGMICSKEGDEMKQFIKAFAIGRVKEIRHFEMTRLGGIPKGYTDHGHPAASLVLFSAYFNDFINKARMIFTATNMMEYDHLHVTEIPGKRIVFNGQVINSATYGYQKEKFEPYTAIVSLIAPQAPPAKK